MSVTKTALQNALRDAFKLLSEGRFPQALERCTTILRQDPINAQAFYIQGMCFCLTGAYQKAADSLQTSLNFAPDNLDTLYNLGVTQGMLHQYDQAVEIYKKILIKDPRHVSTQLNLSSAYFDLKQYSKAIEGYQSLLKQKPSHDRARINLGIALTKIGDCAQAINCFHSVLKNDPTNGLALAELIQQESQIPPMQERIARCDTILSSYKLSTDNRYASLTSRATAEWILSDDGALAETLSAAREIRLQENSSALRNMKIYEGFLEKLLSYKTVHPVFYEETQKTLFMVGDSHCLSYANVRLKYSQDVYKISSHLIMGAKAWHVSQEKSNSYSVALDLFIQGLPSEATLICSFGEIDCRVNEGILPHQKKCGGDLEKIVSGQITQYVSSMTTRAAAKRLKLMFLAVPATMQKAGERREVIRLYNQYLEKCVVENGHKYIDLYTATLGGNGFAQAGLHIDDIHLKPEALIQVLG